MKQPKRQTDREKMEEALEVQGDKHYVLRPYVAGMTPKSTLAVTNIKKICEEHLRGRYSLEVIDLYKRPALADGEQIIAAPELDKYLPPEASDIVISVSGNNPRYIPYKRDRDNEEKLLDRYRDPNDPLQIIIVTAKLLTGFDAPILQAMYLDKPMRDHTLLQAIARVNRPYENQAQEMVKPHGFVLDFVGIFDKLEHALSFDAKKWTPSSRTWRC